MVPATVTFDTFTQQLNVIGAPGDVNEEIVIETEFAITGPVVRVRLDGQDQAFNAALVKSIRVDAGGGSDRITLANSLADVPVTLNGDAGNDTIVLGPNLGGGNTLGDLQSLVTVNGGSGANDRLVLSDSANTAGVSYVLSDREVARGVPGAATPLVRYSGFELAALNAGSGNDSVVVTSTPFGPEFQVNGNGGNDQLRLGTGSLLGVTNVRFNGGTGFDTVLLDDSATQAQQVYTVTGGSVSRSGNGLPSLLYSNAEGLTLNAGAGSDTINVDSTFTATPVTVNAGAGNDVIRLGDGRLSQLRARVSVNGQGGSDSLVLDDTANTASAEITIRAGDVLRNGQQAVLFSGLEGITAVAGHGNDTLDARQSSVAVVLSGRDGDDVLLGSAFKDFLFGDDDDDVIFAGLNDLVIGGTGDNRIFIV